LFRSWRFAFVRMRFFWLLMLAMRDDSKTLKRKGWRLAYWR
jgi:hypothetical protein